MIANPRVMLINDLNLSWQAHLISVTFERLRVKIPTGFMVGHIIMIPFMLFVINIMYFY